MCLFKYFTNKITYHRNVNQYGVKKIWIFIVLWFILWLYYLFPFVSLFLSIHEILHYSASRPTCLMFAIEWQILRSIVLYVICMHYYEVTLRHLELITKICNLAGCDIGVCRLDGCASRDPGTRHTWLAPLPRIN